MNNYIKILIPSKKNLIKMTNQKNCRGREKYHRYFNSKIIAEYIVNKTFSIKTNKYYWEKKI